ncbi:hypothetical protein RCOM_0720660 [Ricinus communis]|uniref:Pectate lyase domain-containing protein n=1 Tax=Ricinus communis TaxID=3988 RepID=B9SK09_RICCO|nr:hypothetical protein RCOM_0720660 [Ricinus communis]
MAVGPSSVRGPNGQMVPLGQIDGDAIRLVSASKIRIDHNTLYAYQDNLLDVTRGSTDVTISNNWFKDQDKVMLLGHDNGYVRDKNMKDSPWLCTFNHNLYQVWQQYAIGGSMNSSIKSEANYFIAPKEGKKETRQSLTTASTKIPCSRCEVCQINNKLIWCFKVSENNWMLSQDSRTTMKMNRLTDTKLIVIKQLHEFNLCLY